MHYEVFVKTTDAQSDRILKVLLDRKLPFAVIHLRSGEADAMEQREGYTLPVVKAGTRTIGGYSNLVNWLERRKAPAARVALVC